MASAVIERVVVRNYRSIRACEVDLGSVTFLVGANGSGKSNFLDALRFVSDALTTSLDQALRERGGFGEVLRRSIKRRLRAFTVQVDVSYGSTRAIYTFALGRSAQGYQIDREECLITDAAGSRIHHFLVEGDEVRSSEEVLPPAVRDRLYLVAAAGLPAFRPVFDALSSMGFYNLNPDAIRDLQVPDSGELLARDGHNLASVLARLTEAAPDRKQLIEEYLAAIVPGVEGVSREVLGPRETLRFYQRQGDITARTHFPAQSMSDGTLRALGVLVAVFQLAATGGPILVGIEEPEMAVHPAAAGVIREALLEAGQGRQIVVTSHSPELLDDPAIPAEDIRAVRFQDGWTEIGPIDEAARRAVADHLFTVGELLRVNQLSPAPSVETPAGAEADR